MRIIVGAGKVKYDGWVSTQENELNLLSVEQWENITKGDEIEAILAEHVWEHLTYEEGLKAAENCYKFLKPGGYIRCAVPDKNFRNEWYQNMVKVGGPGPVDHPAYTHKIVYDYLSFVEVFKAAGFEVELLEYCNEEDGKIGRSFRFDTRNSLEKLGMVSIIIDAKKLMKIES